MPRLLTYNVHRCLGLDGRISPARIAEIIAPYQPDIVALQELDAFRARSGGVDQAHVIAQELGMQMHFHPAMRVMEELYGDAILTARPSKIIKAGPLPGLVQRPHLEPRGALWASIKVGGTDVQVINTHLGLRRLERLAQVNALLGPEWLGHPSCRTPVMLVGDFNAVPSSCVYKRLAETLCDAQRSPHVKRPKATFPVNLPFLRIDHVFTSPDIEVLRVETVRTRLTRFASDHLPLVVDFKVLASSDKRSHGLTTGRSFVRRKLQADIQTMSFNGNATW